MIGCVCEYMCVCDSVYVGEYACVFIHVCYTATVGHRVSSVGSWLVFQPLRPPNWPASRHQGTCARTGQSFFPRVIHGWLGPGQERSSLTRPTPESKVSDPIRRTVKREGGSRVRAETRKQEAICLLRQQPLHAHRRSWARDTSIESESSWLQGPPCLPRPRGTVRTEASLSPGRTLSRSKRAGRPERQGGCARPDLPPDVPRSPQEEPWGAPSAPWPHWWTWRWPVT